MKDKKTSPAEVKEPSGILRHKWYLYLTEFFSGVSVMAVELGASRLLAPYFSSSQIVWTIIIGTIMIAMALGNIYGGRSADKNPDPDRLYARILFAAVWTAAIPFAGKFVILGISALLVVTVNTNFLIWAAFITCMVVFVFPLFLLGTVTPSLVKYTVSSLDDSGKTVGTLGAFNTIGSIIGTFVPTFISIPAVGTAATFLIFSGILLVIGIMYFAFAKRGAARAVTASVLFIVCCFASPALGFAFWDKELIYEGESVYNYLQVRENDRYTALSTNVLFGVQSIAMKSGGLTGMYYDYAMAAPLMAECPGDSTEILILGMGTGTYARQCLEYLEGDVNVEGVEIDDKITGLAREYFGLPESVRVTTYDGRAFLNVSDKKYDVIMVDAYQDITIPFQMSSREFFTLVREHLNDGGVMVVNMNMRSQDEDGINSWLSDTIAEQFPFVYTVDCINSSNRELFAFSESDALDRFRERSISTEGELHAMMSRVNDGLVKYTPGDRILTDDKAPVELLGMEVIDDLIQNELVYYKKVFKEKGIRGLLE